MKEVVIVDIWLETSRSYQALVTLDKEFHLRTQTRDGIDYRGPLTMKQVEAFLDLFEISADVLFPE